MVTPYVGVWIETYIPELKEGNPWSHPTWVCGLKLKTSLRTSGRGGVTPYVGVWIETLESRKISSASWSHPTWVCGLKLFLDDLLQLNFVTPYVGVWIETDFQSATSASSCGHTLRGCVD